MKGQAFKVNRYHTGIKAGILAGALALAMQPVQALDFSTDSASISWDTTISYGIGMRMSKRDDDLIAKAHFNPLISQMPLEAQIAAPGRFSANSDDGNLNFDRHDLIFNQARINTELAIDFDRFGFFARGNYFYDFTLNDMDVLPKKARDYVGSRARLLDAYVYGDIPMGDRYLSMRAGRQVVSWGESTFLGGGINSINPVDVTALRTAGAELKDAFLPQAMLWGSLDFTQNLSAEALWLAEWDEMEAEPSGTYFASSDFATAGGSYAMLNFGLVPQPVRNPDLYQPVCAEGNYGASDSGLPPELVAAGCAASFPRAEDNKPGSGGQYGAALRYFAPWFGDTEFGLYYLRYHSRLPLLSGRAVTGAAPSSGAVIVEYPEEINLFGVSFNTNLAGWSVGGEVSYRNNLPIQIDDVELLYAGLSPLNAAIPEPYNQFISQLGDYSPGEYIQGYERRKVSQAQVTFIKVFGPGNLAAANELSFVAEVGTTHVWNLPDPSELRFEGPGTDTFGGPSQETGGNSRSPTTTTSGFVTKNSWGYRLALAPSYNNVFGSAWNMTPSLAFNHDVSGVSPGPGGNFVKGRKQATVGVSFDYMSRWQAGLSYTNFFGGGINNLLRDRDFVSASLSYSF